MADDSSFRTQFRQALQKALHLQLLDESGSKLEVVGGQLQGPQERDIACVWWDRKTPFRAAILEQNFFGVRVFKRFKQDQGGIDPRTLQADALEQAAEDLEAALKAVLTMPSLETVSGITAAGDQDFFNVLEVRLDYPGQFVEAALTAFATNRSSAGG